MTFIGKIIKKTIELTDPLVSQTPIATAQEEVLKKLLEKAKETEFGKYYHFKSILQAKEKEEAFAKAIPTFDYERMEEQWWHRTIDGVANVSWPGQPEYFALSSGTTGNSSKKIPVTNEMIEAIRSTGLKQVLSLSNHDLPDEFFQKEILMLGSSTDLKAVDDHYEGEISGISASNIPFWFRGFYKPGQDIANIDDWDERVLAIAKQAKDWDIGAISGIPSWIELMLQKVIDHHQLQSIHDIWPNLKVFNSGGVAFDPYRESFDRLTDKEMIYLDTYLASEGFMAFQSRPNEDMAMQLVYDGDIYFEFIPFQEDHFDEKGSPSPDAPSLTLREVEEDQEYALLISTVSGAWRYSIGDTIRFTNKEKAEIKITGRTKHFLNVVGSQLSVAKMTEAIEELGKMLHIEIPEFAVAAIKKDNDFYHHWILGIAKTKDIKDEMLSEKLDKILKGKNKNYKVARSKALAGVSVKQAKPESFYDWQAKHKKKGGQVKMPRMLSEEQMNNFKTFLSET